MAKLLQGEFEEDYFFISLDKANYILDITTSACGKSIKSQLSETWETDWTIENENKDLYFYL